MEIKGKTVKRILTTKVPSSDNCEIAIIKLVLMHKFVFCSTNIRLSLTKKKVRRCLTKVKSTVQENSKEAMLYYNIASLNFI